MRGRQQVYLTIGCAPNWPVCGPFPGRDMLIFRDQGWAEWEYVHPSRASWGRSGAACSGQGACPLARVVTAGHVRWRVLSPRGMSTGACSHQGACSFCAARAGRNGSMSIPRVPRGACPVLLAPGKEHVRWRVLSPPGMSTGACSHQGACSFFAARTGRNGSMSIPRMPRGACPPGPPQAARGGPNWAKPESSGILVSAFDSEATGEFA